MANPEPTSRYNLKELAELIIRDKGIKEGLYDATLEFQIAVGAVGPAPEVIFPGVMVGISSVGIIPAPRMGPHTVDAAAVNSATKKAKRKPAKP